MEASDCEFLRGRSVKSSLCASGSDGKPRISAAVRHWPLPEVPSTCARSVPSSRARALAAGEKSAAKSAAVKLSCKSASASSAIGFPGALLSVSGIIVAKSIPEKSASAELEVARL